MIKVTLLNQYLIKQELGKEQNAAIRIDERKLKIASYEGKLFIMKNSVLDLSAHI